VWDLQYALKVDESRHSAQSGAEQGGEGRPA
jgi:hypothetical protein